MKTQKKVVVITGGAGGIGQACARAFKNDPLILTDYSQEKVDSAVSKLANEGFEVSGIACDITAPKDIEKLVNYVSEAGQLKALIHTAGVSGTVKDVKKVYTIDLVATNLLVDAFYNIATKNSVAILLASMMAHAVPPNEVYDQALTHPQEADSFNIVNKFVQDDSDTMYNFAKRGVLLLTQKNANKWGDKGARIVSVSPGVIETAMALKAAEEHPERMEKIKQATPLKRNGQPEDVANVIQFLASNAASFITGTDILVDGGVIHNIKKMG
ncbi:SDR family oxidoreductase [Bizionia sediminis]|uniref:SDR family oxidoreductase n=1 Tax=Bizionia sediminis TaxID=1737064 RepID=A0ABW5KVQ1_9FLAO